MELVQDILMWLSLPAALGLTAAGVVIWCDAHSVFPGRRILWAFRRLPWPAKLFLVAFVAQLVVHGSTKSNQTMVADGGSTNAPLMTIGARELDMPSVQVELVAKASTDFAMISEGEALPVTDADIARGYRLESVVTNVGYSFTMPTNGVLCGHWHQRGAYDDVTRVDFGDWTFPIGTTVVSRLWAFVNGSVRPAILDANHVIAPVGTSLSAIPPVSRLWTAVATNDARLVTWENFAIGRIRRDELPQSLTNDSRFLSAQIELFPNGDFVVRSNALEIAYRRIDPNDWDGDGWHNDNDPEPKFWTEGDFGIDQDLPTNANEDAYCWVDVRAAYNSYVHFVGDGPSNLPDPAFTARAGVTYRVMLLIGKRYEVSSDQPLSVVACSSEEIEVEGNGTTALSIRYPVDIYALEGNGRGFRMFAHPARLGGQFAWTNSCCSVYGENSVFRYGCVGSCGCTGCWATGSYAYEGYRLPIEGGWCGCSSQGEGDDDPNLNSPGAAVSFSKSVIFLEDTYWNTPSNEVPWQSTDTLLTCDATGGDNGGVVTFSISGGTNLVQYTGEPLPYTRTLAPNETVHFVNRYKAVAESASENDIVATATFVENNTGWTDSATDSATAVKVEIKPVVEKIGCENRHVMGIRENFEVIATPDLPMTFDFTSGWAQSMDGPNLCKCPLRATVGGFGLSVLGDKYFPDLQVVTPGEIVCRSGFNRCSDGYIAMELEPYVTPQNVSFSGIRMMEVPTDYPGASGYFTNLCFESIWHHTLTTGAGVWHHIGSDNFFFADTPSFAEYCPPPISFGSIDWVIPIAWGDLNAVEMNETSGSLETIYHQVFTLDEVGTLRIDKFAQWIQCTTNGVVTSSPGIR